MAIQWRKDRSILVLAFTLALCLVPLAAYARLNGSDFANDSLQSMQAVSEGWHKLFQDTFLNPNNNSIWFFVRSLSQIVLALAGVPFIMRVSKELARGIAWQIFALPILTLSLCVWLIGGSASPGLRLVYAAIQIKDHLRDGLMEQSLAGVKLNEAVKDVLLTDDAKSRLTRESAKCDAIVAPPVFLPSTTRPTDPKTRLSKEQDVLYTKMECYTSVAKYAESLQAEYEKVCFGLCSTTVRFVNDFKDAVTTGVSNEVDKYTQKGLSQVNYLGPIFSIGDMLTGGVFFNIVKTLMHILQHIYINAIQAIYFLSLLTFPVAVAWSTVPFSSSNSLKFWVGILFGTMLAEFYYVILISLSALIISRLETTKFSDIITASIFGLGAPAASYKMATWNAAGAISGITSSFGQIAQAVPIIGGLTAGFTRFRGR
ncbi:MAG: hypothetical protein WCD18_11555 [Thermosynechococcaceae cyanobacterium]